MKSVEKKLANQGVTRVLTRLLTFKTLELHEKKNTQQLFLFGDLVKYRSKERQKRVIIYLRQYSDPLQITT